MEIIYDHLLFPKWWFCSSLLYWQDIFAWYEIDCLQKKSPFLSVYEFALNDIWIFLTPKGGGRGKPILVCVSFEDVRTPVMQFVKDWINAVLKYEPTCGIMD